MIIRKATAFLILMTSLLLPAQDSIKNIIIVVIDGIRYSEGFGAGALNMPRMYNDLLPKGAFAANFFNDGITLTNSGHASLASGTWQNLPNDGSQRPAAPVIFEYFRKWKGLAANDCYVVTGKPKLSSLTCSSMAGFGQDFSAADISNQDYPDSLDEQTWNNLQSVMDEYNPRVILVNFPSVDLMAHAGIWENYLAAIRKADSLVYCLWQKIQDSPVYQNNTLLFVTSDHGRHNYDREAFSSHGDDCEGCRHVFLLAIGPYVKRNLISQIRRTQIDLLPTIAALIDGFEKTYFYGVPMQELFDYKFRNANGTITEIENTAAENLSLELSNRSMKISWRSNGGYCLGYGVQMSYDMRYWKDIAFINADSLVPSGKKYEYTKFIEPHEPKTYYRLAVYGSRGIESFSKILEAQATVSGFSLFCRNYPNPFNPATTVEYIVGSSNRYPYAAFALSPQIKVRLDVYDILGKNIATLVNSEQKPGWYTVNWDASNFAAGIYLCRLQIEGRNYIHKMLLLK